MDTDILVKTEFIISVLINIEKISDIDFLIFFISKIQSIFENEYTIDNFNLIVRIFKTILLEIQEKYIQKHFLNLIKFFVKKFFLVYEKDKDYAFVIINFSYEYIIEDFNLISNILKNNNENNFFMDFLNYLLKHIFEPLTFSVTSHNKNNPDYKNIFYKNYDKVYKL